MKQINHSSMILPTNYNDLQPSERRLVREEYVRLQYGRCSHCGGLLIIQPPENIRRLPINKRLFPETFFKYPVHLHHDHKTGMTIGAVHSVCNAVLWQYHGE